MVEGDASSPVTFGGKHKADAIYEKLKLELKEFCERGPQVRNTLCGIIQTFATPPLVPVVVAC